MKIKLIFVFFLFVVFVLSCAKENNVSKEEKIVDTKERSTSDLLFLGYKDNIGGTIDSLEQKVSDYRKFLYGNLFLEKHLEERVFVDMNEIRKYYFENKFNFIRKDDLLLVAHFISKDVEEAKKVGLALSKKDGGIKLKTMKEFNIIYSKVKKGDLPPTLDNIVFSSYTKGRVVGPIKTGFGYHVVEIIDHLKSGSLLGLDEVYDQISQNIYNYKKARLLKNLTDSLLVEYKDD